MAAYFIIETRTKDKDSYAKYISQVRPIVESFGGKYLSRGGKTTPVFGGWDPERMILIEFPSSDDIKRWLESPEYKKISGLRENSTITRAVIIEGIK